MPLERARRAASTHEYDFLGAYVEDLGNVIDMEAIRASGIRMGVDPLGGAGVHYWPRIAERYGVDLTVISERVDPTFAFMTLDWDGRIRMDPSSSFAMQPLIAVKDRVRHRVRMRYGPRSTRHRDERRGLDAGEPLSGRCHRPSVPQSRRNGAQAPLSARPSSAAR